MFGDGKLEAFDEWFSTLERGIYPKDFLWQDSQRGGFVWYYVLCRLNWWIKPLLPAAS